MGYRKYHIKDIPPLINGVIKDYQKGYGMKRVAKHFGISYKETIKRILILNNIPIRTYKEGMELRDQFRRT